MVLNERKLKILQAIINDYIATAEPISSRSIAKKYNIGLSSATIRNEMSDLEELGLIIQPHISSGRIPSDKGYRLYVDNLMRAKALNENERELLLNIVKANINRINNLMQETAKAVALITKYTAIASEPFINAPTIKHIQLAPFDSDSIIMILITDAKVVKYFHIKMPDAPDFYTLSNMSLYLNGCLAGKNIDEINAVEITETLKSLGPEGEYLAQIIDSIINNIAKEMEVEIYTSGAKNILAYPEFSDIDKAKSIFQTLEEKDVLIELLSADRKNRKSEIRIMIGGENSVEQMKECSVVSAGYQIGDKLFGSVGILGPTRMNYARAVSTLRQVEKTINAFLRSLEAP
jgi:heat-inducible transcriptional repressor